MAKKIETKTFTAIVLDFETGGLDPKDCAITQVAMQMVRLDTWQVLGSYSNYIAPYSGKDTSKRKVLKTRTEMEQTTPMKYEPRALEYTAITMNTLYNKGVEINTVAKEMLDFIEQNTLSSGAQYKPLLIGQNITFDIGFLQQLMNQTNSTKEFAKLLAGTTDYYGNFQPHYLDTITLGRMALAHRGDVTSYKLEMLAEHFGVELFDAHDAMADVSATLRIAAKSAHRLRQDGGNYAISQENKTRTHFKI